MALIKLYRFTSKSGSVSNFLDPDDMADTMQEENELEYIWNPRNPVQFDIGRDIERIKMLRVGGKFRHDLGNVECLEVDDDVDEEILMRGNF
jgi:hypothetical protein